jgi:chemotaxis protein methyltransferase CheR
MVRPDTAEEIELRLVLEAIYARYGYDFREYAPDSIRRRVQVSLARSGLAHLGELQHRLLVDPSFFATMVDDLTVKVSSMFRDTGFFRVFRERVVPILRTYPHLKIWHAGCATGEEVYATAIVLAEENLYDRCQIYATDMSGRALERAHEGVYEQSEVETFAKNYLESGGTRDFGEYYSAAYGRIALKGALRRNIVFFQHDLASDSDIGQVHVVFCRNVLIYFGLTLRERVLRMLGGSLCRGGFLCLGSSERLPNSYAHAFSEFAAFERIYRSRSET